MIVNVDLRLSEASCPAVLNVGLCAQLHYTISDFDPGGVRCL